MACEHCTDLEHPDYSKDEQSLFLAKNDKGETVLVATHFDGDGLVYFATKANYCLVCGRKL